MLKQVAQRWTDVGGGRIRAQRPPESNGWWEVRDGTDEIALCFGCAAEAKARRVAAALSACEGIPTEALESGVVAKALAGLLDEIKSLTGECPEHGDLIYARCAEEEA